MEDSFFNAIPKDLTIDDCIVDVGEGVERFKTMEEQNEHFCERMIAMARDGHDEEDGWAKVTRLEPEGIDVFEREVKWSTTPQMRSRWMASCGLQKVAQYFLSGVGNESVYWKSEFSIEIITHTKDHDAETDAY